MKLLLCYISRQSLKEKKKKQQQNKNYNAQSIHRNTLARRHASSVIDDDITYLCVISHIYVLELSFLHYSHG